MGVAEEVIRKPLRKRQSRYSDLPSPSRLDWQPSFNTHQPALASNVHPGFLFPLLRRFARSCSNPAALQSSCLATSLRSFQFHCLLFVYLGLVYKASTILFSSKFSFPTRPFST
jgi:hypothetical protein